MAATKVELFDRIRHDSWREGLSVRALARKYGVHRRLVPEALSRAEPTPRKTPERRSPRLEPLKETIDGWLRADLDAPRKQRHTVKRIHACLLKEHGAAGVSYSAVRDYVSRAGRRSPCNSPALEGCLVVRRADSHRSQLRRPWLPGADSGTMHPPIGYYLNCSTCYNCVGQS